MSDELPSQPARPPKAGSPSPPLKIRERSFAYALRAIKLYRHLQKQGDGVGWILGKQYLRSACSVGANVEEAQAGESRSDFVHKLGIAQKEARESLYWLRLLAESHTVPIGKLGPLIQATEEITRILASIILTTKRRKLGVGPKTLGP
jgi:four helix bundle protein